MKKTYQFGILAEKIAIIFLKFKGYKILQNRYKTKFGEIDIIASKKNLIIFIEVKARKKRVNIEELISQKQIQRMQAAANFYISGKQNLINHNFRFDFIEIHGFFNIKHHLNFIS
jgi:putative endonuclease